MLFLSAETSVPAPAAVVFEFIHRIVPEIGCMCPPNDCKELLTCDGMRRRSKRVKLSKRTGFEEKSG